ncbi:MAG: sporulation protein YunB [Bacillota bacterium]
MKIVTIKRPKRRLIALIIIIIVAIIAISYGNHVIYPLLLSIAEEETRLILAEKINIAGTSLLTYVAMYSDLYSYTYNTSGDLVLISANTTVINQLYIIAQAEIQAELSTLSEEKINIPIGAFLGSSLLADLGKNIGINIYPVGTATIEWSSEFVSTGINQSIHRTSIIVTSTVEILIPIEAETITMCTEIIVAENIIVGDVPDTYLIGADSSNMLDLIP